MGFNILERILNFLFEKNIVAIPLVTLIILFIVIGIISSKEKVYQWIGRKIAIRVVVRSQRDLKEHSLFIKEPKYKLLVQNSKFGTSIKDRVFRFILIARLRSTIDNTLVLLMEYDIQEMPVKKLQYYLQENNRRIVEQYNRTILKYLETGYGLLIGDSMYEYIMNTSPTGFNTIYDSQIIHIDQLVEFLCKRDSVIFKNNIDRFEIYLHELNSLLYLGIINAENMFRTFNGNLEKIVANCEKIEKGTSIYNRG